MSQSKNILIAPLNWGLGHATRCIPLIKKLKAQGHHLVIASDGAALDLLKQEFPDLPFETLPAYHITYARHSWLNFFHLLRQVPHILRTKTAEKKKTAQIIERYAIDCLISDNRFGVFSDHIKSIYMTHQLRVPAGIWTFLTTFLHRQIYKKYDEIWVPDRNDDQNLSGALGHLAHTKLPIRYLGILSRMKRRLLPVKYRYLAILSGPEPQRSLLEEKIRAEFSKSTQPVAIVQGKISGKPHLTKHGQIDIYNYLPTDLLEKLINQSETLIARSGYTSVMDMFALEKQVIWVPTPGQPEQTYLARYLARKYGFNYIEQKRFKLPNA